LLKANPGTGFIIVTRYNLHASDEIEIRDGEGKLGSRVRSLRYFQIAQALSQHTKSGAVARLLSEYLEDIGVTYRMLDQHRAALAFMAQRWLNLPYNAGLGRLQSAATVAAVPKSIEVIFGNISALGDWIASSNRGLFNQQFRCSVTSDTTFRAPDLSKLLQKQQQQGSAGDEINISGLRDAVSGGTVYFHGHSKLKDSKAFVEFGYYVEVSLNKGAKADEEFGLYTNIWWPTKNKDEWAFEPRVYKKFPDEMTAQGYLRDCLQNAIKEARGVLPNDKGLKRFQVP
jgi:hypothetical protein